MLKKLSIILLTISVITLMATGLTCCSKGEEQNSVNDVASDTSDPSSEDESSAEIINYSLSITGGKREFYEFDKFDSEGIIVTLIGGKQERVLGKEEYEIDYSTFNSNSPGDYVISVSLKTDREVKAEYTVTVKRDEENDDKWGGELILP